MTNEEKELLLCDICARLPYGVKCQMQDDLIINDSPFYDYKLSARHLDLFQNHLNFYIKPYLRPMSSITEDEKKEMHKLLSPEGTARYDIDGIRVPATHYGNFIPYEYMGKVINYLLSKHFDVYNLIPTGLAIEVTEENNPYK